MSGGLTPCRQLRPSSRRELVRASNSHVMAGGGGHESQTLEKLIKVYIAQLLSKTLKSVTKKRRMMRGKELQTDMQKWEGKRKNEKEYNNI